MRWNVAKLAAKQSVIYTAIKWSFTKHTQYALDGGFVKWDGLLMHSDGGDVGVLHGGGKCQTDTIHHGAIKRPAAP